MAIDIIVIPPNDYFTYYVGDYAHDLKEYRTFFRKSSTTKPEEFLADAIKQITARRKILLTTYDFFLLIHFMLEFKKIQYILSVRCYLLPDDPLFVYFSESLVKLNSQSRISTIFMEHDNIAYLKRTNSEIEVLNYTFSQLLVKNNQLNFINQLVGLIAMQIASYVDFSETNFYKYKHIAVIIPSFIYREVEDIMKADIFRYLKSYPIPRIYFQDPNYSIDLITVKSINSDKIKDKSYDLIIDSGIAIIMGNDERISINKGTVIYDIIKNDELAANLIVVKLLQNSENAKVVRFFDLSKGSDCSIERKYSMYYCPEFIEIAKNNSNMFDRELLFLHQLRGRLNEANVPLCIVPFIYACKKNGYKFKDIYKQIRTFFTLIGIRCFGYEEQNNKFRDYVETFFTFPNSPETEKYTKFCCYSYIINSFNKARNIVDCLIYNSRNNPIQEKIFKHQEFSYRIRGSMCEKNNVKDATKCVFIGFATWGAALFLDNGEKIFPNGYKDLTYPSSSFGLTLLRYLAIPYQLLEETTSVRIPIEREDEFNIVNNVFSNKLVTFSSSRLYEQLLFEPSDEKKLSIKYVADDENAYVEILKLSSGHIISKFPNNEDRKISDVITQVVGLPAAVCSSTDYISIFHITGLRKIDNVGQKLARLQEVLGEKYMYPHISHPTQNTQYFLTQNFINDPIFYVYKNGLSANNVDVDEMRNILNNLNSTEEACYDIHAVYTMKTTYNDERASLLTTLIDEINSSENTNVFEIVYSNPNINGPLQIVKNINFDLNLVAKVRNCGHYNNFIMTKIDEIIEKMKCITDTIFTSNSNEKIDLTDCGKLLTYNKGEIHAKHKKVIAFREGLLYIYGGKKDFNDYMNDLYCSIVLDDIDDDEDYAFDNDETTGNNQETKEEKEILKCPTCYTTKKGVSFIKIGSDFKHIDCLMKEIEMSEKMNGIPFSILVAIDHYFMYKIINKWLPGTDKIINCGTKDCLGFCFKGSKCKICNILNESEQDSEESDETLGVKPCPSCGFKSFLNEQTDCNAVQCRQCGKNFCWCCLKIYKDSQQSHACAGNHARTLIKDQDGLLKRMYPTVFNEFCKKLETRLFWYTYVCKSSLGKAPTAWPIEIWGSEASNFEKPNPPQKKKDEPVEKKEPRKTGLNVGPDPIRNRAGENDLARLINARNLAAINNARNQQQQQNINDRQRNIGGNKFTLDEEEAFYKEQNIKFCQNCLKGFCLDPGIPEYIECPYCHKHMCWACLRTYNTSLEARMCLKNHADAIGIANYEYYVFECKQRFRNCPTDWPIEVWR